MNSHDLGAALVIANNNGTPTGGVLPPVTAEQVYNAEESRNPDYADGAELIGHNGDGSSTLKIYSEIAGRWIKLTGHRDCAADGSGYYFEEFDWLPCKPRPCPPHEWHGKSGYVEPLTPEQEKAWAEVLKDVPVQTLADIQASRSIRHGIPVGGTQQ
jgi:hypothetical protein